MTRPRPLVLALWAGLLAGTGEALLLGFERHLLHRLIFLSDDFWWMAPLGEALLFLPLGLLLDLGTRRLSEERRWRLSLVAVLTLAGFAILQMYPPLHWLAALVIALGVAVQLSRWLGGAPTWFLRVIPISGVLVMLLGLAAALLPRYRARESAERAAAAQPAARSGAPNVLVILLDTVRAMSLSLYGYERETSPRMAHWAAEGVTFERTIAPAPWTLPSHASLFTGRWPHELGLDWHVGLAAGPATLAERFGAAGYRTAGFVGNTTYCSPESGLDRGFAHWEAYPLSPSMVLKSTALGRLLGGSALFQRLTGVEQPLARRHAPDISGGLLRWLDRPSPRPYFAFLNYFDAHAPYLPPAGWSGRFGPENQRRTLDLEPGWPYTRAEVESHHNAYDASVAYLDEQIGQLLDSLDRRGQLQNTIVVITADHGEEFREHGFMDHGNTLYRPSVQVPLIIRYAGHLPAGIRVDVPVSLRNVGATLMELAGMPDSGFPGRSLSRTWAAPESLSAAAPDTILSEVNFTPGLPDNYPVSHGRLTSLVESGLRYIRNAEGPAELYDFDGDAAERHDLAPAESENASRLGDALDRITADRVEPRAKGP